MKQVVTLENFVSEQDISQPRTLEEYIRWFKEKLEVTKQLPREAILHKGIIPKRFYEELYPLYRLLQNKREEWKGAEIIPCARRDQEEWDVEVRSDKKDVPKYIQIADAYMDRKEKYRMECFRKDGSVSLVGNVVINEKTKEARVEDDLVEVETEKARIKAKIAKTIKGKMGKKAPEDTALLVAFDDNTVFRWGNAREKEELQAFLDSIPLEWWKQYAVLYLVGLSGKSLYEKQNPHKSLVEQSRIEN